jgi:hypothetical protein
MRRYDQTTKRASPLPTPTPRARMVCAFALVLACLGAHANDRPYLSTNSAAAEEDDEGVWSVESWVTRLGSLRTFNIAPEYAFNPTTSLQLELGRARDRNVGESLSTAELEFKHLFNHIARDGYGWGAVVSLGAAKASGGGWKRDEWGAKLPLSISLWEGEGLLHLNAGFSKLRDDRREWNRSIALEREVWKRTTLFAELAREGDATLLHAGVRYWVKREKFALDFSLQRVRSDGVRENGGVIGIGWYDL